MQSQFEELQVENPRWGYARAILKGRRAGSYPDFGPHTAQGAVSIFASFTHAAEGSTVGTIIHPSPPETSGSLRGAAHLVVTNFVCNQHYRKHSAISNAKRHPDVVTAWRHYSQLASISEPAPFTPSKMAVTKDVDLNFSGILGSLQFMEQSAEVVAPSPVVARSEQFRDEITRLRELGASVLQFPEDEIEYQYQVTLFRNELGKLKNFLGASPAISELVSELLTVRFEMLGKDTPRDAMRGIVKALSAIVGSTHLDTDLVDMVVKILESSGFDSLAPDALRNVDE